MSNQNNDKQPNVKIVTISQDELKQLNVENWSIWNKDESEFDWYYPDQETCYILEGEADIITDNETVTIKKGDFVIFPKELNCRWKITKALKKYYKFG